MGAPKAGIELAGEPLIERPLRAMREARLEAVVVAKPGTALPPLDVPVWQEPEEPAHPLAGIVAAEMDASLRITSGPALERAGDLAAILTNLDDGDVLFIDEIHRLPKPVEEVLYPAMEDFQLDIVIGKGPSARSIRLELPRFTLVGATTRTGLITGPLRDRFGFVARLDYYDASDLVAILERTARILGVPLDADGAAEIARRARGTPRISHGGGAVHNLPGLLGVVHRRFKQIGGDLSDRRRSRSRSRRAPIRAVV